jgi:hypothetical protein
MSSNDSEHISPHTPLVSLLADAKVDDFKLFGLGTVKNVFRFDITMADVSVVQVLQSFDQLPDQVLELLFIKGGAVQEAGLVEALHYEVGAVVFEVQVEGLIFDDGRMAKLFQVYEISLQFKNVLFFNLQLLGRIDLS